MQGSALKIISSLDAGSKNRLRQYQARLGEDYDRRNFDSTIDKFIRQYLLRPYDYKDTKRYLRNLRSKKDGKLYSQGVKEYKKLKDSVEAFGLENHSFFGWNKHYKRAKMSMLEEFSSLQLSPLQYSSDEDIVNALPKLGTHAGFEWILSGHKEKGENLEDILKRYRKVCYTAVKYGKFSYPILVAERTQGKGHAFDKDGKKTGDCDHKTRAVSMIALMVILAELRFSKGIQEYMAKVDWYAGGKDLNTQLATIIIRLRSEFPYWISIDYSAYDSSISAWLIHDAFEIIRSAYVLTDKDAKMLDVVERSFIEKDFILADKIVHSVKGVPSGSMFTQIIDSIVNRLIIKTYMYAFDYVGKMCIMGDDNIVFTSQPINPEHLASYVAKNFGISVNPDKMANGESATDDPEFLSCFWTYAGRYREPHELIGKLLYPERFRIYNGPNAAKVEEVLYSYYLAYPCGMTQIIDLDKLIQDFPRLRKLRLSDVDSRNLPGFMKYLKEYDSGYWATVRQKAV